MTLNYIFRLFDLRSQQGLSQTILRPVDLCFISASCAGSFSRDPAGTGWTEADFAGTNMINPIVAGTGHLGGLSAGRA